MDTLEEEGRREEGREGGREGERVEEKLREKRGGVEEEREEKVKSIKKSSFLAQSQLMSQNSR